MIRRYELRSETGRSTITEVEGNGSAPELTMQLHGDLFRGVEVWRVNLEERGGALVETGSWPIVPASRANARFA